MYCLVGFPIALTGFGIVITLFFTGIGTLATLFSGVILIIGALHGARGFGTLDVILIEWTGRRAIPRPEWQDARAATGFFGWLRAVLGNGHYWLYLLQTMVVDFIIKTVTWTITIAKLSIAVGGLSFWFRDMIASVGVGDGRLCRWLMPNAAIH